MLFEFLLFSIYDRENVKIVEMVVNIEIILFYHGGTKFT